MNMNILFIEGDDLFGGEIKDFISKKFPEIKIDTFPEWTRAAFKIISKKVEYSLVIFDKGYLAGMTSAGAVNMFKKSSKVPVILMGGSFTNEERSLADYSLLKPFPLDDLSKAIKEILGRK